MKVHRTINLTVNFWTIDTHADIVNQLSPAFSAESGDSVHLSIRMKPKFMLYSDKLLLIIGAVNYLRKIGVTVSGLFMEMEEESARIKYASRVNFFKHLNFAYHENFERRSSSGRFTEISLFDSGNSNALHIEIMRVLINQDVNKGMLEVLESCLWEVIDNTLNHSHESFEYGAGYGFLCCQCFQKEKKIRIMISDNGQGIHAAILRHPKSTHHNMSESTAVHRSIEKGFTNGGGQGFGLWATAEMIRQNRGKLIIQSGNWQLSVSENTAVIHTGLWKGTFTFLELNTNIPVDHKMIWGQNSEREQLHSEFREGVLANLTTIW